MPDSQFSDDLYLAQLLVELREVYGTALPHFSPLRALGSTVAYDSGVYAEFWKIKIGAREIDSHVLRSLTPAQRRAVLPNRYYSLFLRPETPFHVTSSRAKDSAVYEAWKEEGHRGYYWVESEEEALDAFRELSQALGASGAAVCASPCFADHAALQVRVGAGTLWQESVYLAPESVRGSARSYVDPRVVIRMYPKPAVVDSLSLPGALIAGRKALEPEPLGTYLMRLWHVVRSVLGTEEEQGFAADRATAEAALGPHNGRLPVDPLALLPELEFGGLAEEGRDLLTWGSVFFAIERLVRERCGAHWLLFYT